MAITLNSGAGTNNKTSSTSQAFAIPSGAAGVYHIVTVTADNLGGHGELNEHVSVVHPADATFIKAQKLREMSNSPAGAGSGVTTSLWLVRNEKTFADLNLVVNFSAAVVSKSIGVLRVDVGSGNVLQMITDNFLLTTGGGALANMTLNVSPSAERLFIRCAGLESGAAFNRSTNFTHSSNSGTAGGSATTNTSGAIEGVISTATSVTSSATFTVNNDWVSMMTGFVEATLNQPPVANAGADQTITLPTNQVTLTGSGTDPDGTIASYAWTQQIGPNTATLTNANTATLTASGLVQGTYTFRLTVTDNGGATGTDDVTVTVLRDPATIKKRIIMVI